LKKRRAQLADWEAAIPLYQQKYASELLPLVVNLMDMQVKFLHSLDRACDHKEMKKSERAMIASFIVDLAGELLSSRDDAELKAVYNKHSNSDYDKQEAANIQGMKSMMEDVLGVDLGDDMDMSSPEDLFKRAQAQMEEEWAQDKAEREAWEALKPKRKKYGQATRQGSAAAGRRATGQPVHPRGLPEAGQRPAPRSRTRHTGAQT